MIGVVLHLHLHLHRHRSSIMEKSIKIKFHLSGLETIDGRVDEFAQEVALDIKNRAKDYAPVLTGALRDSIEVIDGENNREKYIGSITIPYAIIQELGTIKMSPQPYLIPALDEVIREL